MNTYCSGCDAVLYRVKGPIKQYWIDDNANAECEGMGGGPHIEDTNPLNKQALKATLMNYYGELEMKLEYREFDDETIKAEMNRILRIVEEMEMSD